jgi:hypothetical protein
MRSSIVVLLLGLLVTNVFGTETYLIKGTLLT